MCKKMEDLEPSSSCEETWQGEPRSAPTIVGNSVSGVFGYFILNLTDLPFQTYYQLFHNQCVTNFGVTTYSSLSLSGYISRKLKF